MTNPSRPDETPNRRAEPSRSNGELAQLRAGLSRSRRWTALAVIWALAATVLALWALVFRVPAAMVEVGVGEVGEEPEPGPAPEPFLSLERADFSELPGWLEEDHGAALEAALRACRPLARVPAERKLEPLVLGLTAGDWSAACRRLEAVGARLGARAAFEQELEVWALGDGIGGPGLFTGYYEPTLRGSRTRRPGFETALYRRPRELVSVDLGRFREGWKGERIAGAVQDGALVPFASRAEIERGALERRGLELVWVDDPVDAFFLHIQGSGRVELLEGGTMRVGYGGQNGHPYVAVGRELIDRGELNREEVSMQTIRRWLAANPSKASALLERNPSFVFFRELEGEGPTGSLGVPLIPGRSLAIDRRFLPLGAVFYLAAEVPGATEGAADEPFRRVVVAMDTGGAIRGPVRGDLFWGPGEDAAERAGRMKHPGRLWLLSPPQVASERGTM